MAKEKIIDQMKQPTYSMVKGVPIFTKNVAGEPTVYLQVKQLTMGDEFKIKHIPVTEGYIYGDDHCYHFSTPKGWQIDNFTAKKQAYPIVFYPTNSTWSSSPVVAYTKTSRLFNVEKKHQIKAMVNKTINDFKTNNSPNIKAEYIKKITSNHGHIGELWKYTGDQWGNIELVSYFVNQRTINFFVYTARNKKTYLKGKDNFFKIINSYREADDCVSCQ